MNRPRFVLSIGIFCLTFLGCRTGDRHAAAPPAPAQAPRLERIGYLEHRGQRYSLTDLMDASYRQTSFDPFVRGFEPERELASPWAGLANPVERSPLDGAQPLSPDTSEPWIDASR